MRTRTGPAIFAPKYNPYRVHSDCGMTSEKLRQRSVSVTSFHGRVTRHFGTATYNSGKFQNPGANVRRRQGVRNSDHPSPRVCDRAPTSGHELLLHRDTRSAHRSRHRTALKHTGALWLEVAAYGDEHVVRVLIGASRPRFVWSPAHHAHTNRDLVETTWRN